jgi:hypothetical protein
MKGMNSFFRPEAGTRCLVSGPNCDNDDGYIFTEFDILWRNDTFVLYGNTNCYPNLNRWEQVIAKPLPSADAKMLVRVEPQPEYIEESGRWKWPLNPPHDNDGKCPHVYTASRQWWEYVPSGAKPHPWAEGVMLRDEVWYWAIPA